MNIELLARELRLPVAQVEAAVARVAHRAAREARFEADRKTNRVPQHGLRLLDAAASARAQETYTDAVKAVMRKRGADPFLSSSEDDVVAVGLEAGYPAEDTAGKLLFDRRSGFEH